MGGHRLVRPPVVGERLFCCCGVRRNLGSSSPDRASRRCRFSSRSNRDSRDGARHPDGGYDPTWSHHLLAADSLDCRAERPRPSRAQPSIAWAERGLSWCGCFRTHPDSGYLHPRGCRRDGAQEHFVLGARACRPVACAAALCAGHDSSADRLRNQLAGQPRALAL